MAAGIEFETWYERFQRFAADLYPASYSRERVRDLVEMGREVRELARQKHSLIVAHNYVYPELQEIADAVGDSLALSQLVARASSQRVDFCGVWFMGETAKMIVADGVRVFMPDRPGCSLVTAVDRNIITHWIARHAGGVVIAYVNSDAGTKALSHYVCTSGNATRVLEHVARTHPGRSILFLPDKYLGAVALAQSQVDPGLVDLYDGACHVHARIDDHALGTALDRHPNAELLIHPECGCAPPAVSKGGTGKGVYQNAYFLSTEQMLRHAATSMAKEFIVATETGMVYRLRKELPGRRFHPVCPTAVCEYMKMNTLEKLLASLREDRVEVEVEAGVRQKAREAVQRMLAIQ
jgi:quinolinate synthase